MFRIDRAFLALTALLAASMAASIAVAGPVQDLAPGHWLEMPNSKLNALDPCPGNNCSYSPNLGQGCVADAWTGGAFDSVRNRLIAWGGGHNCYGGNEVYVFDVLGTQRWARVSEPSTSGSCNQGIAEYPDGTPCAAHTYDYVDFHPGSDSFVLLGSASPYGLGGGGAPTVHLFSFDTNSWRRGADRPGDSGYEGATSAYDPNRDAFWVLPAYGQRFAKYEPAANGGAGKWTMYSQATITIDGASAVDPVHDLFVTVDARGTQRVIVRDLKNPGAAPVTVTTSGATAPQSSEKLGFEWDSVGQTFVSWIGGTSVYTLAAPSGDWRTGTWVWRQITAAAANTVTPTSPNENGTYSKFRYMPSVNAFIVYNRVTDNVFVYKLSASAGAPQPTVSLSANPTTVNAQGSSQLTWSTSNADACTASGGWSGSKATAGSETVGPLSAGTTFTLACTNTAGGTGSNSVTVSVTSSTPAPTVSLSASPAAVPLGSSSTLSWMTSNATSCTAGGGWSGSKSVPNGSQSVGPINAAATFSLSCTGSGGTTQKSIMISILPAPTVTLSANPRTVQSGQSSQLSWSSANAASCSASGSWAGNKPVSGTASTGALTATSAFTLACDGGGGSASASVSVTVQASTPAPTLTLSASPTTVDAGGQTTLTWSTQNATACTAADGWSGPKSTSGTASVGPLAQTSTFVLDCSGTGGSINRSVTVTVQAAPGPGANAADSGGGALDGCWLAMLGGLLVAGNRRRVPRA
jgi:hypothetical protein